VLRIPTKKNPGDKYIRRSVTLSPSDYRIIKDNNLSLSKILQDGITVQRELLKSIEWEKQFDIAWKKILPRVYEYFDENPDKHRVTFIREKLKLRYRYFGEDGLKLEYLFNEFVCTYYKEFPGPNIWWKTGENEFEYMY
jgi:hypothetical protein